MHFIKEDPSNIRLMTVMTDFFMEHFKEDRLRTAQYKLKYWLRYVDDMFIVCP